MAGVIVVDSGRSDLQHQGITLNMEGAVSLQLSAKSVGLFEAFYNSLKVIKYIKYMFIQLFEHRETYVLDFAYCLKLQNCSH